MSDTGPKRLSVKKYANRRFYDATRGGHLTLDELHDLVCEGWDIDVVDSKSGENITNVVLTQIILDRHAAKLAVFPTPILHQVIRTQQQYLGSVVEEFFRQSIQAQRTAQETWARFFQNTLGGMASPMPGMPGMPGVTNPVDWTRSFLQAMGGAAPRKPDPGEAEPASPRSTEPAEPELAELRRQLAELQRKMEDVQRRRSD